MSPFDLQIPILRLRGKERHLLLDANGGALLSAQSVDASAASGFGPNFAADQLQECALARTVVAQYGPVLSREEGPTNLRKDAGAGEGHINIVEFDEWLSHRQTLNLPKNAGSGKKTIWREAALP
jgi:hypothetical protein